MVYLGKRLVQEKKYKVLEEYIKEVKEDTLESIIER